MRAVVFLTDTVHKTLTYEGGERGGHNNPNAQKHNGNVGKERKAKI